MVVRNELETATRVDAVRGAIRHRRHPAPGYGALTRLAQETLGVSAAFVTLLDDARQHFVAGAGLPSRLLEEGMPAPGTLCHRVLLSGEPLLIDDTAQDPTTRHLVPRSGLAVRAYAGYPLRTTDGFVLGSFCAADTKPRRWTPEDRRLLARLAEATAAELELRAELSYREDLARPHDQSLEHEGMLATAPEILASITDAFLALDRDWRFTWVNPAARSLLGGDGALIGRLAWAELPLALTTTLLPQLERAIESGRPYMQDDPIAIGARWFAVRAFPARHGISVFLRDETARVEGEAAVRQRDERLRQAQKMEAIGLLTGGVAHDFNNVLTVIQANADVLIDTAQADGAPSVELVEIQRATERAARLTRQLLAFSRKQVLQPRTIDPNAIVGALLPMLRRLIPPAIRIETELGHELPSIHCDPGQLEQVLLNLAVNGRDAIARSGTLSLTTGVRVLPEPLFTSHAALAAGRWVTLTVADTGEGIPVDLLPRVFEPFFTTKPNGTGLGLATVYGIVQQSGGAITVESTPGVGTSFTVWFTPREVAHEPVAAPAREVARGRGSILLVDDEPAVRSVLERSLVALGYNVLARADGAEAVALAGSPDVAIDLLVTDIAMPGMDGIDVLHAVRLLRPALPALLLSGFTDSEAAHEAVEHGDADFLAKPFSLGQLAEAVRAALAPRRGAALR